MSHISRTQGHYNALCMKANNTHILTIVRDFESSGKQIWLLLHGHELEAGFEMARHSTRRECEIEACQTLKGFSESETLPEIAREHGWRQFQWMKNREDVRRDNPPFEVARWGFSEEGLQ